MSVGQAAGRWVIAGELDEVAGDEAGGEAEVTEDALHEEPGSSRGRSRCGGLRVSSRGLDAVLHAGDIGYRSSRTLLR